MNHTRTTCKGKEMHGTREEPKWCNFLDDESLVSDLRWLAMYGAVAANLVHNKHEGEAHHKGYSDEEIGRQAFHVGQLRGRP